MDQEEETHNLLPLTTHPLQRTVKAEYAGQIKSFHNSVFNPPYPVETPNQLPCIAISVIGIRTAQTFLESKSLVSALRYIKPDIFAEPEIRGVASMEWPKVCSDIYLKCKVYVNSSKKDVIILKDDSYFGDEKDLKELIKKKFFIHLRNDYRAMAVEEFAKDVRRTGRTFAYMHIEIDMKYAGCLIIMLYTDLVPLTCENFLRLCRLKRGGYPGSSIHRIVKDGWIQCGGYRLTPGNIPCENYTVPPDRRGVLCMANNGRHSENSTQFFILLEPAEWMHSRYVAFGQVVEGSNVLEAIESTPTDHEAPLVEIKIIRAGVLNLEKKRLMVKKNTNNYLDGHIDDLGNLQEELIEWLYKKIDAMIEQLSPQKENMPINTLLGDVHQEITKARKFMGKSEDVSIWSELSNLFTSEDETFFQHNVTERSDVISNQKRKTLIPLTNIPYVGEVNSEFNFARLARGYYSLQSDLVPAAEKDIVIMRNASNWSVNSTKIFSPGQDSYEQAPSEDELSSYIRMNADRASFAGEIVRGIARKPAKTNLFSKRWSRLGSHDSSHGSMHRCPASLLGDRGTSFSATSKKPEVKLLNTPSVVRSHKCVKKAVRIAAPTLSGHDTIIETVGDNMFGEYISTSDLDQMAHGFLEKELPTLKGLSACKKKCQHQHCFLSSGPEIQLLNKKPSRQYAALRDTYVTKTNKQSKSQDQFTTLRHGTGCFSRKASTDYILTRALVDNKQLCKSIRAHEYKKTRPSLTISEYKNQVASWKEAHDNGQPTKIPNYDRGSEANPLGTTLHWGKDNVDTCYSVLSLCHSTYISLKESGSTVFTASAVIPASVDDIQNVAHSDDITEETASHETFADGLNEDTHAKVPAD